MSGKLQRMSINFCRKPQRNRRISIRSIWNQMVRNTKILMVVGFKEMNRIWGSHSGSYEGFNRLGYIATRSSACYLFHAGLFLGLFFDLEDRGDMVRWLSTDYTALYPRRLNLILSHLFHQNRENHKKEKWQIWFNNSLSLYTWENKFEITCIK
jgi:hypothetical protein